MKIMTNNQWRMPVTWAEVPNKIKDEFDYIDHPEYEDFFQYRGAWYELGMFMRFDGESRAPELTGWDGHHADSFFSGVLVKLNSDGGVRFGTYYS